MQIREEEQKKQEQAAQAWKNIKQDMDAANEALDKAPEGPEGDNEEQKQQETDEKANVDMANPESDKSDPPVVKLVNQLLKMLEEADIHTERVEERDEYTITERSTIFAINYEERENMIEQGKMLLDKFADKNPDWKEVTDTLKDSLDAYSNKPKPEQENEVNLEASDTNSTDNVQDKVACSIDEVAPEQPEPSTPQPEPQSESSLEPPKPS
jgi:hypothetical protein